MFRKETLWGARRPEAAAPRYPAPAGAMRGFAKKLMAFLLVAGVVSMPLGLHGGLPVSADTTPEIDGIPPPP